MLVSQLLVPCGRSPILPTAQPHATPRPCRRPADVHQETQSSPGKPISSPYRHGGPFLPVSDPQTAEQVARSMDAHVLGTRLVSAGEFERIWVCPLFIQQARPEDRPAHNFPLPATEGWPWGQQTNGPSNRAHATAEASSRADRVLGLGCPRPVTPTLAQHGG